MKLLNCSADELCYIDETTILSTDTLLYSREMDRRVFSGKNEKYEITDLQQRVYLEVKTPIYDNGTVVAILGIATDITHQKKIEYEVRNLALTDHLTGLANRRLLSERIKQAIHRSKRLETYCAILFVDLNKFKSVNDTYGHEMGDALLVEVARRLSLEVRMTDTVSRFGGDEFIILLEDLVGEREQVANYGFEVTERMKTKIAEDVHLDDIQLNISASIGISLFIGDEYSMSEIISHADKGMYQQKHAYYISES